MYVHITENILILANPYQSLVNYLCRYNYGIKDMLVQLKVCLCNRYVPLYLIKMKFEGNIFFSTLFEF